MLDFTKRESKDIYYIKLALMAASRSTCIRRCYGAVIVKNDRVISTGYNGSPKGCYNCSELNHCPREQLSIPSGERYELCRSLHAEENAIMRANPSDLEGATLYLAGFDAKTKKCIKSIPCIQCKKRILNSGISRVVNLVTYDPTLLGDLNLKDMIREVNRLGGCLR